MAKGPKRPTRDEFQMEEIGEKLVDAKESESEVILTVWASSDVRGVVIEMDARTGKVHVKCAEGILKVPFMDIMQVTSA